MLEVRVYFHRVGSLLKYCYCQGYRNTVLVDVLIFSIFQTFPTRHSYSDHSYRPRTDHQPPPWSEAEVGLQVSSGGIFRPLTHLQSRAGGEWRGGR